MNVLLTFLVFGCDRRDPITLRIRRPPHPPWLGEKMLKPLKLTFYFSRKPAKISGRISIMVSAYLIS